MTMAPFDNAKALFREKSRSFSLAARFFRPDDQTDVARLYRFCRCLDDLADDSQAGDVEELQVALDRLTGQAVAPPDSFEADFLRLSRERSLPREPALELVKALQADCGSRVIRTDTELIRFAYGVAGTVGQMLRFVIGAGDPRAEPFAIDLGIALQLSNVMRDVAEDTQRGRFYLPSEWVLPAVVERALDGDRDAEERVNTAIRKTYRLAEMYYDSAKQGFSYIPNRNRRVIFLAAALYREIGTKVLKSGAMHLHKRIVLTPAEKVFVGVSSIRDYQRWNRNHWQRDPFPQHPSVLHTVLGQVRFSQSGNGVQAAYDLR
jgi:phytoene synthase